VSDDKDWRLEAALDSNDRPNALDRLLEWAQGPRVAKDAGEAVPADVVITHDGDRLFAYAPTEAELSAARRALETVLRSDGVAAKICVSRWDSGLDEWLQVDPPLTAEAKRTEESVDMRGAHVESRTMVASTGKMIRAEVEQTMREWAEKLGLECEVIEHPHLLTTQLAFTVTGPRRKIDEFADGLRAEELATMRAERAVMMSPL